MAEFICDRLLKAYEVVKTARLTPTQRAAFSEIFDSIADYIEGVTRPTPAPSEFVTETWTDDELWQIVNEFDDRTSPEEYPEMVMLNEAEFRDFLDRGRTGLRARIAELELIRDSHSRDTLQALLEKQAHKAQLATYREALEASQKALAMMISPDAIKSTTVASAFATATEVEAKARATLSQEQAQDGGSRG